jgi:Rv2525c-like, glycoside hydrolase-like domain/CARDB
MSVSGIDYRLGLGDTSALSGISVPTISADGYQFVGEYIGNASSDGYLTYQDATTLSPTVSIVSLFERSPTTIEYFTTATADYDATDAIRAAENVVKQPIGTVIYFTVDPAFESGVYSGFGALSPSYISAIENYFAELSYDFSSDGKPYQIGIYGPGDVLSAIQGLNLSNVDYYWLDTHWGTSFSNPNIQRNENGVSTSPVSLGISVDTNTAYGTSFGQWSLANALPDIVIDSLTASSATLGGGIEVSTTIGNNSAIRTAAFAFDIYFSTDPHLDSNAHFYTEISVPSLEGNGTTSWGQSILLPSWITTGGTYYVIVDANENQTVTESNYNNDSFSVTFAVQASTTQVASGNPFTVSSAQTSSGMTVDGVT